MWFGFGISTTKKPADSQHPQVISSQRIINHIRIVSYQVSAYTHAIIMKFQVFVVLVFINLAFAAKLLEKDNVPFLGRASKNCPCKCIAGGEADGQCSSNQFSECVEVSCVNEKTGFKGKTCCAISGTVMLGEEGEEGEEGEDSVRAAAPEKEEVAVRTSEKKESLEMTSRKKRYPYYPYYQNYPYGNYPYYPGGSYYNNYPYYGGGAGCCRNECTCNFTCYCYNVCRC